MFIKENNIEKEGLQETFTVSTIINGKEKIVELKPLGSQILISESNKLEYLQLRTEYMCYGSVKKQLDALMNGFFKVIPESAILGVLNGEELENLICGQRIIDIKDWQKNTEYHTPYTEKHKVIQWFWKAVNTYSQQELSNLIKFCTGTSRIPIQGFIALESNRGDLSKFSIHQTIYNSKRNAYPQAHTCFNRLLLPSYPNYEELKKRLDFIVKNEVTGFGID